MLGFVDDQRHWLACGGDQFAQRFAQGQSVDLADLAGVDVQRSGDVELVHAGRFGGAGDDAEMLAKLLADGGGNQVARIAVLVAPQVNINDDHADLFQPG